MATPLNRRGLVRSVVSSVASSVVGSVAAGGGGALPITAGLVEWWTLNETSGNRVGSKSGIILSPTNAPAGVAGKIGNAVDLVRASSQYLTCINPAILNAFTASFSVSQWCNADALGSEENWFWMAEQTMGTPNYAGIRTLTGNQWQGAVLSDNLAESSATNTGTVTAATWIHTCMVYSAQTQVMTLYINSVGADGAAMTLASTRAAPSAFVIGSRLAAGQYVDGLADECAVWERAITPLEVSYLYNGGAGRTYATL